MNLVLGCILAYVASQLLIAFWFSRRTRNEEDYLLAGRSLGPWMTMFAVFATWFGAETCIGAAGEATRIPHGQLEGAELIVLGAVTAFDAGISGGALPIPIPLGDRGDFGVMHLAYKRGYIAMDLRVVDARTGRVLSSVAVNGRNSRFGMDFNVHLRNQRRYTSLPGVLRYFQNTPVEKALQEMVTAAVDHIAERVSPAAPVH